MGNPDHIRQHINWDIFRLTSVKRRPKEADVAKLVDATDFASVVCPRNEYGNANFSSRTSTVQAYQEYRTPLSNAHSESALWYEYSKADERAIT